jgi:hypothetical protein
MAESEYEKFRVVAIAGIIIAIIAFLVGGLGLGYALYDHYKTPDDKYNKCLDGPSYWCANDKNFALCMTSKGEKGTRSTYPACNSIPPSPNDGYDKCLDGPSYWCANDENFALCVQSKGYNGTRSTFKACEPNDTR